MNITSEQAMIDFGKNFAQKLKSPENSAATKGATVIELIGDVGAGKTTFTRGLGLGLGVKAPITSPSFTISKSYALAQGGHLVHYDFYRLPDPGLMTDDLQENLRDPQNIIVIEWGESIANLLPQDHLKIQINYTDHGREIII